MRGYTYLTLELMADMVAYVCGPTYEIAYEMGRNGVARVVYWTLYMVLGASVANWTGECAMTATVWAVGCYVKCGLPLTVKRWFRVYTCCGGK